MVVKFTEKVVIVTGASSGIGAAIAVALAAEGAKLAICGRNEEKLEEVAAKCRGFDGCEVLKILCDLTEFDDLKIVVDKTVEKYQQIDILINNAGIARITDIASLELEMYDKIFSTNIRAPMFLCKYALPHLKKTKGCVVNISSMSSTIIYTPLTVYSITKAALDHFTRLFAAECLPFGVRVNSINPGIVETPIYSTFGPNFNGDDFKEKVVPKIQPLGIIESEEISEVILSTCALPHMTGACTVVDGGTIVAGYSS